MTRYEIGFMNKCAEYGVDGQILLGGLQKNAGIAHALKRLSVKLHPRVNPEKLNWFTRLFTTTKRTPYRIIGSTTIQGIPGNGLPYGVGGMAGELSSSARGMREVTRLSPEKILAALGIAGAAGTGAYKGLSGKGPASPVESGGIDKKLLMKLLAGTAAVGAGGAIAAKAVGKSKNDDEDDEKKRKKSGNR